MLVRTESTGGSSSIPVREALRFRPEEGRWWYTGVRQLTVNTQSTLELVRVQYSRIERYRPDTCSDTRAYARAYARSDTRANTCCSDTCSDADTQRWDSIG